MHPLVVSRSNKVLHIENINKMSRLCRQIRDI
jgi:hypothetical protein